MVIVLALGLAGLRPMPAAAASDVTFTLTIPSAFLRETPSLSAAHMGSIFKGETYDVTGRNSAGDFLLRAAYHEAVHAGQMLDYLRTMGVARPSVWD